MVRTERLTLPPADFMRERLGWWQEPAEAAAAAITGDAWAALATRPAAIEGKPAFAVASAPDHSWTAIASAWLDSDGLVRVELVDYRPGTAWVRARARDLATRWSCQVLVSTAARGLLDAAAEPSQGEQAQAHNAFVELVKDGGLRHSDQPALNVAAATARWKPMGDSRLLNRRGTTDISPLDAAALAASAVQRAPAVADFYVL